MSGEKQQRFPNRVPAHQPTARPDHRGQMVEGKSRGHLSAQRIRLPEREAQGGDDGRQQQDGVLPDDAVGLRGMPRQLTARTEEEVETGRGLDDGMHQVRVSVHRRHLLA